MLLIDDEECVEPSSIMKDLIGRTLGL